MLHMWRREEMRVGFWRRKLEGKTPLGRSMCRWEDGIVTDPKERGWDSVW
jgi:hypothetical protein